MKWVADLKARAPKDWAIVATAPLDGEPAAKPDSNKITPGRALDALAENAMHMSEYTAGEPSVKMLGVTLIPALKAICALCDWLAEAAATGSKC